MLRFRAAPLLVVIIGLAACSDDGGQARTVEVEPSFELDSGDARQLVAAIEALMEADSFVLTAVTEPTADDDRQEVRMTYDAPGPAMVETDRLHGEDTVDFFDGSSILLPFGDDGGYIRRDIEVDDFEVDGVDLDDVEINVAEVIFSPLRRLLDATDVEREGDELVLTGGSDDRLRARLDGDGALVEVVLIGPESGREQVFTFSEVNAAGGVDLPDDVTNFDVLPDCDEPRPISAGSCRG